LEVFFVMISQRFGGVRRTGPHRDRRLRGAHLKDTPAPDLGATAIAAAIGRAQIRPDEVETAAMGNVVQAGVKMNPARQAAIHGGLR